MIRGSLSALLLPALLGAQDAGATTPATVTIRARIQDENGRPLAGAGIVVGPDDTVTTVDALQQPAARSAIDGTIAITMPQLSTLERTASAVLIAAPGRVAVSFRHWSLDPSRATATDIDLGDLRLPKGHRLTGRVRDGDGKAVPGARVVATDCLTSYGWSTPGYGSQALTDDRGVFVLPGVFAEALRVDVLAAGFYDRCFAWIDLTSPLDVQLAPSGFVEGVLLDEHGEPRTGRVTLTNELPDQSVPMSTDGRFRIPLRRPCRFRVTALDLGDGYPVIGESELLQGPQANLTIRASSDAKHTFVVRAIDAATREPVVTFRAAALWFSGQLQPWMDSFVEWSLQSSRADGSAWLPMQYGSEDLGVVWVRAAGHAPFVAENVKRDSAAGYTAELVADSRIEGRVVDAVSGEPLAAIEVTCARTRPDDDDSEVTPARVRTAADGSFSFASLGAGPHDVRVCRTAGTAHTAAHVDLKAASTEPAVELRLPRGVAVSGRVKGGEIPFGWQLALAPVDAKPQSPRAVMGTPLLGAWNEPGAVPIVDGAFRFERRAAGAERLLLIVPQPPRQGAALRIPVQDVTIGDQDLTLEIDLAKHLPASIAGNVKLTGAEVPLGRVAVIATRLGEDQNDQFLDPFVRQSRRRWNVLAPDGSFSIPVEPGSYELSLLDVATSVVLHTFEDALDVAAGRARRQDLAAEVAGARIEFEGGATAATWIRQIQVMVGDEDPDYSLVSIGGGAAWGSPGLGVVCADPIPLFVPPGPVRLRVLRGASGIGRGMTNFVGEHVSEQSFEVAAGEMAKLTLKLPNAPSIATER